MPGSIVVMRYGMKLGCSGPLVLVRQDQPPAAVESAFSWKMSVPLKIDSVELSAARWFHRRLA